ncbi:MAG: NHLP bacteriocin system secretion protein [Acidobacteriota bacterium]
MDPRERLFRKAALDKMASPERLDELMRVTKPAGWLALTALAAVIFAAIAWGLFGSIAIKVQGSGILLRGEAVLDVTSGTAGRLTELLVEVGQSVEAGDVVARVEQPSLALQIDNLREELASLRGQRGAAQASSSRILQQLRAQRDELRSKIATQEDLASRGLITRSTLLATKGQLAALEQNIAREQQSLSVGGNRVADLERQLREMERKLEGATDITSPYGGRVLELMVDPGNLVTGGSRLLTLESVESPIEAVVFVPATTGKRVREGMEVRISPSTHKAEEFGFILGEVERTSVFPATPEGIQRVLRNRDLAQALAGEGPKIELKAELASAETPSGFRWTSADGPPDKVYSGTLCEASVVVERKRPISYVLPILKQAVSGG